MAPTSDGIALNVVRNKASKNAFGKRTCTEGAGAASWAADSTNKTFPVTSEEDGVGVEGRLGGVYSPLVGLNYAGEL